jgi:type VI protein secretion system component Hcp
MANQSLTYLLKIDGVTGDSTIDGYEGYFTVDEFTFNELTRLANGGSGGGAGAGKAQFDPLMVDIAGLSPGLVTLLKDAATGKHIPSVELVGLKPAGEGQLQKVYDLTLNNVTVAGYAADGGHDTAIAFDYTRLTGTIKEQNPDGSLNAGQTFTSNVINANTAVDHNALAALAHSHEGPALTYLLKIDGATGDSTIDGYEGYFRVDEFTFNEFTRLANGGGGGAGAGKAQFDPLMVDIAGLSPGLVTLLKDAATGKHIKSVELVGLKPAGEGALQKVYDLTLNNVTVAGYAADGGHGTAIAFDYTKLTETIKGQNPDGSLGAGQTFTSNVINGNTAVDHNALAALAHSHQGPALTYLIKIDGATGDSTIDGYQGYFRVDEFTFNELTRLANGGGGGGGASKAQFDPLMVDIAGLSPGLVTLLKDAASGKHIASVELVGLQSAGKGELQKVYDLTLNNVTVAGYAADGGHDTAIAFDYTRLTETIKDQNPDGSLNAGQTFAFNLATNGGSITPVNHNDLAALAHSHGGAALTYLIKIDGVSGDSTIDGYEGYFGVDEFTFNELTRLGNGGAGGGAGAGKAQFDPLVVDLAGLSPGLVTLLKDAATGKHIKTVELVGLKPAGEGALQKVYDLTLDNVTVAGYAADSGHDTAIAFDYTRLTETIKSQNPDGSLGAGQTFTSNVINGNTPVDHNALAAFAHSHQGAALTYLIKIDGATGDSTIDGYQGYFKVDEFTFNELTKLANGGGGGGGAGKAQFDPLMVDIAGLSPGLVTLLKDAATGKHISSVELVGLQSVGEGQHQKVYDLTLHNVTVAGYAADSGHDTAVAFDYTRLTETINGQNSDGSLNAGKTFDFNLATNGGSITPVNHNALAAFAHSHEGPALTYLLRVDGVTGDSTIDGYQGDFKVDEFTFNELTKLANGGGGAGAGKAQFDPLMVDIAGLSPGLVTLLKDAATGKHIASVELIGLQPAGEGQLQKVYDLRLNNVTVAGYAADSGHDTAIAFDYTRATETIKAQNPDGSLNAGQTFTFNVTNGNTPVDHNALAAFAHAHDGFFLA